MSITTTAQQYQVGDYVQYMGSRLRARGTVLKVVRVIPQQGAAPLYILQDAWIRLGPCRQSSLRPDPWLTNPPPITHF